MYAGKLEYMQSLSQPPNVELHWLVSIQLEIVLKSGPHIQCTDPFPLDLTYFPRKIKVNYKYNYKCKNKFKQEIILKSGLKLPKLQNVRDMADISW